MNLFRVRSKESRTMAWMLVLWLLMGTLMPFSVINMNIGSVQATELSVKDTKQSFVNSIGLFESKMVAKANSNGLSFEQRSSSGQSLISEVSTILAAESYKSSVLLEAKEHILDNTESAIKATNQTRILPSSNLWMNSREAVLGHQNTSTTKDLLYAASTESTGSISGVVTSPEGALLTGIGVRLYNGDWNRVAYTQTDSNGQYAFTSVFAGSYMIRFEPYEYNYDNHTTYTYQYYNNSPISGLPTLITVGAGQAVANINGQLHEGGSISGTVYDSNNKPLPGITVTAIDPTDTYSDRYTNSDGDYYLEWMPAVNYMIQINPAEYNAQHGSDYLEQWYNNCPDSSNVTEVSVTEGQITDAVDAWLKVSSGTVRGVRAEGIGNQITVSWIGFSEAQSYNIYRTTYSYGQYEKVGTSNTTTFKDTNLPLETKYWYKVKPVTSTGEGDFSAPVSAETNSTASTDPLDNWRLRSKSGSSTLNGVYYGNNTFLAVGRNGTILTSLDGIDWINQASGTPQDLNDVCYGNNTFVAVGYSGTILTSADGISWVSQTSGTTNTMYGVAYGNNTFVAVDNRSNIYTSADGKTWMGQKSPAGGGIRKLSYVNNIFIAVGESGTIITSLDGINWNQQVSNTSGGLRGVTFGNNTFVAVGSDYDTQASIILTSPDAITWSKQTSGITGNWINAVSYGNGTFVLVGGNGIIQTSTDGVNWIDRPSGNEYWLFGITNGKNTFVTVGSGSRIFQSARVSSPLRIITNNLPGVMVNKYMNASFSATGGNEPYTWSVKGLPEGVNSNPSTGAISGTPKDVGTYTLEISVTDSEMQSVNTSITWVVNPEPIAVTGISINKSSISIIKGKTEQLTATVIPDNAVDKRVTWSIQSQSENNVATISDSGLVKAINTGTAVIRVASNADNTKYAECLVTVVAPQSTISRTTANFDKKPSEQADITITLTLNGNNLEAITNVTGTLLAGTDYVLDGNILTITKKYLANQPVGTTTLSLLFSAGTPQSLIITVVDTTPQAIVIPSQADFVKANQTDLKCILVMHENMLSSIVNGNVVLVRGKDYTLSGNTVTILKNYLALQPVGTTLFTFKFSAGANQTLAVSISNTMPGTVGIINTIAGDGFSPYSGDGGPAVSAGLSGPGGLAFDSNGNMYIADRWHDCIRKVSKIGIISTVAGNGTCGYSGDGGPAISAQLSRPIGVSVDESGNLYVADTENHRIRKIDNSGIISTIAGNGVPGYSGDNGPATSASLNSPGGIAVDSRGSLYIADTNNNVVRVVTNSGTIGTVAGNGIWGYSEDGGQASSAELNRPTGLAFDGSGDLYFAETGNNIIRKVDSNGIITTVAGNHSGFGYYLSSPTGIAFDYAGNLYIADSPEDWHYGRISVKDPTGQMSLIAGNGFGHLGDGGLAAYAKLTVPYAIATDGYGNLYIADSGNDRIRRITMTVVPNSTLTDPLGTFDKRPSLQTDVTTTVMLNGNSLLDISNGDTTLKKDVDYTFDGSTVTISKGYLANQPVGITKLTFAFSAGAVQYLFIAVSDTADSIIHPTTGYFDKQTSMQADVTTTMTLNDNTLSSIMNEAATLVPDTDYVITGNQAAILRSYLVKQPVGTTTLTFHFSNGAVQYFNISVVDTNTCEQNIVHSVSAVNGTLTVLFSAPPVVSPTLHDFIVTQSINGAPDVAVAPCSLTLNGTTAILTVPQVAFSTFNQNVVYKVSYKNGPSVQSAAIPILPSSMVGGNSQRTSQSLYLGPITKNDVKQKWCLQKDDELMGPPVLGFDGTIYFTSIKGTDQGYLYAINPDMTQKWVYQIGGTGYYELARTPAVSEDGVIFVGGQQAFYAFNPDGSVKWKLDGAGYNSSPAIGPAGDIYVSDDHGVLWKLSPAGNVLWHCDVGVNLGPAIGHDGVIYVITKNGLNAINIDGTIKWNYNAGALSRWRPAVGPDNTVYYCNGIDLYAINPGGTCKWHFKGKDTIVSSPAIANDGTVYVGSTDGHLYAIEPDGNIKWSFIDSAYATSVPPEVRCTPLVDSAGTIYFCNSSGYLYALYPNGSRKWTSERLGSMSALSDYICLSPDGVLYIPTDRLHLYAIGQCRVASSLQAIAVNLDKTKNPSISTEIEVEFNANLQPGPYYDQIALLDSEEQKVNITTELQGSKIIIRPLGLCFGRDYTITVPTGAVTDQSGNVAGESTGFHFITESPISYDSVILGYDPNQCGLSPNLGPDYSGRKWTSEISPTMAPVVGSFGTIYTVSADTLVYVNEWDGISQWQYKLPSNICTSPVVGPDGTIYVRNQNQYTDSGFKTYGQLYAFNPYGSVIWSIPICDDYYYPKPPVVGSDGVIYLVAGTIYDQTGKDVLYAFNRDGSLKWTYEQEASTVDSYFWWLSAPAVSPNNEICFVCNTNLVTLYPDGRLKWTAGSSCSQYYGDLVFPPVISKDGSIYVSVGGAVHAFGSDQNRRKWIFKPSGPELESLANPVLGPDGTIYAVLTYDMGNGGHQSTLYAIGTKGEYKWSSDYVYTNGSRFTEKLPAIDGRGVVYFVRNSKAGETLLIAMNPNGTIRWSRSCDFLASTSLGTGLTIGNNKTLYGKLDGKLTAIGDSNDNIPISGAASAEKVAHQDPISIDEKSMVQDPVNAATGAHLLQRKLLFVNGVQLLDFRAEYNSLLLNAGPLGRGWNHNYETYLEIMEDGIKLHWTTNRWNQFIKCDENRYESYDEATFYDQLVKNADGTYTLTRKDQTIYEFDTTGKLAAKKNKNGQTINLTYNPEGKLYSITEPVSGRSLLLQYNAAGLVEMVTDCANRKVQFTYDPNYNLTGITDANGKTTTYTYNSDGQVLTAATEADGVMLFTNTYDSQGRVITQDDAIVDNNLTELNYDDSVNGQIATTVTDRNGKSRILVHDNRHQLLSITDENGYKTIYTYDANGNQLSAKDANGQKTTYTYDKRGNQLSITDPVGHTTYMNYDDRNNLLSITRPDGKSTFMTYDNKNNLLTKIDVAGSTTTYTYDDNSLMLSKTVPGRGTTNYTYENGLLKTIADPEGVVTSYGYDDAGRITSIINGDGNAMTMTYDALGQPITITDPLGHTIAYTYDCGGNLLSQTDANGNMTKYAYNGNGKITKQTNALGYVTAYEYDGEDRLTKITDPLGHSNSYSYDANGRLIKATNALGQVITTAYDPNGNIISITDASGNTIQTNSYDNLNQLISTADALGNTSIIKYDLLGNVNIITKPKVKNTILAYDANNRLVSVTDPLSGISAQSFNAAGDRISLTTPNGNRQTFNYNASGHISSWQNALGNRLTYTYNNLGLLNQLTNGRGQANSYSYDNTGKLTGINNPEESLTCTYDNNGNLLTISNNGGGTIRKTYDALNRITSCQDGLGNIICYQYDEAGNLVKLTYPDDKQVNYQYDKANRMTKVRDWAGRETNYEYDVNGRMTKTTRPDDSILSLTYDATGQITQQKDIDKEGNIISQYDFTHDQVGNILAEESNPPLTASLNNESTTMIYDIDNRLISFNDKTLTYDNDGNLISGPLQDDMANYIYDSQNRLIQAGNTIYSYDAQNNRIQVKTGEEEINYIINTQPELSQVLVKEQDGIKTCYIYGIGLIGEETGSEYITYHYDRRGSTVALSNKDGIITDRYSYDPFGKMLDHTGSSTTGFLYNGRDGVIDDGNGLYYMRARYYSPQIKRFINQDVLIGSINNGQSLNRYAYANGQPVNMIDPFGLSPRESNITDFASDILQKALEEDKPRLSKAIGYLDEVKLVSNISKMNSYKIIEQEAVNLYNKTPTAFVNKLLGIGDESEEAIRVAVGLRIKDPEILERQKRERREARKRALAWRYGMDEENIEILEDNTVVILINF